MFSNENPQSAAHPFLHFQECVMASSTFFIPSVNVIGADSLTDAMNMMADYGFTRTLIVTDNMLTKLGMAGDVQKALEERNIFSVIYDGTQPNPTTQTVAAGLK